MELLAYGGNYDDIDAGAERADQLESNYASGSRLADYYANAALVTDRKMRK